MFNYISLKCSEIGSNIGLSFNFSAVFIQMFLDSVKNVMGVFYSLEQGKKPSFKGFF